MDYDFKKVVAVFENELNKHRSEYKELRDFPNRTSETSSEVVWRLNETVDYPLAMTVGSRTRKDSGRIIMRKEDPHSQQEFPPQEAYPSTYLYFKINSHNEKLKNLVDAIMAEFVSPLVPKYNPGNPKVRGSSAMEASSMIVKVTVIDDQFKEIKILNSEPELARFANLWEEKKKIANSSPDALPEKHYKLQIQDKERSTSWLYSADGRTWRLSKAIVPTFTIGDAKAFNELIGLQPTGAQVPHKSARRPSKVPSDAFWIGGRDGGVFISPFVPAANKIPQEYFFTIYNDQTGEIEHEGTYVINDATKDPKDVHDSSIYSGWDGEFILLTNGTFFKQVPPPNQRRER
jgi:hypothetical protein